MKNRKLHISLLYGIYPVADPECAREGGVSHILAEKRMLASLYSKKCMKRQYFHQ